MENKNNLMSADQKKKQLYDINKQINNFSEQMFLIIILMLKNNLVIYMIMVAMILMSMKS